ncbi:MAG TPA: hypothetical protein VN931_11745 [Fibrobacteria bacterium]|nr:hypothetical protein [Fibrobacteria bacterium]
MISTILSCLLPLASGIDADFSVNLKVAPGVSINLHSPAYYDQRERDRQERLDRIQADREEERNREAALDREKPREQGGVYLWRDTPEARERQREELRDEERRNEAARATQERLLREEEARDADERRLAMQREREEQLRARGRHEEDQRYQREDNLPREEDHGVTRSIDE